MSATAAICTQFEPGALPADGMIPLCVPEVRGREWQYVKECLDGGWVSSVGPFVDRFERMMAERVGTRYAVATVNGTSALHVALKLAGVEAGDEVLVSTLTFIAPANAIRYLGAHPVFIDAESRYWQMDVEKLAGFLRDECVAGDGGIRNRSTGRRIGAIVPVHILGHSVDLDAIGELSRRYDLPVVEDCAESLGTTYKGRQVGAFGQFGCFSFNGNKIITTGGGGMITTNDPQLAAKAKYLTTQAKDDPLEYIHEEIGYNYRLSNMQAAMGCAQIEVLDEYVAAKRRHAELYAELLADIPGVVLPRQAAWSGSTFWLYTVLIDPAGFSMDSRQLSRQLLGRGIQTRPLWQPLHRSPAHAGAQGYRIEVADRLYAQALSLPSSVGLAESQIRTIAREIRSARA